MLYLLMPGTRCSLREALLCPGCQQQKRNRQRGGGGQGDAPKINANLYRGKLFNLFFTLFLYDLLCFTFRFVSFLAFFHSSPTTTTCSATSTSLFAGHASLPATAPPSPPTPSAPNWQPVSILYFACTIWPFLCHN